MVQYDTAHVKNIALLGHAGCGKTTFAEAMLFESGILPQRGSVEEENTASDDHELEKNRHSSVFTSLLHIPWKGYKINILDTPGYSDFCGEVLSSLRVADTGVMLLNASAGVEVGTDLIWDYTERFKTPMLFVINQLDHPEANYERTLQEAIAHFGNKLAVVQFPVQTGNGFQQIVDVLNMVMYEFPTNGGKPTKVAIPASLKEKAEQLHQELVETIAAHDESLMEKFFDQGTLSEEEMKKGLHDAMIAHDLFPVFCASGKANMGAGRIMGFIDTVCPSANERPPAITLQGDSLPCNANGPTCLFVFKTILEPHIGELSLFKVFSGTVKAGMELLNEDTGVTEKFNQLFLLEGHKRIPVNELAAGDIGATMRLKSTHINNTLHEKGKSLQLTPILFPQPNLTMAVAVQKKGEEEKLSQALHSLQEEDATIRYEVSAELKQTLLHCQGELHLQMIQWKMENEYNLNLKWEAPRIPYRETIRTGAQAMYRHKKQSGGAGQFAEVTLQIEPYFEGMPEPKDVPLRGKEEVVLPWGGKLVFYNCIVGGAIDQRFLPSILKGIMEKMQQGPLTGSYARDIRVLVTDGKMHAVDSNDMAFKVAGLQAFRTAFIDAQPQLLEPVYAVELWCPNEQVGAVMGDLQTRMGIIEGMETANHLQKITAKVPLANLYQYASALRGMTQGRARFQMQFSHYAPVNQEAQRKLVEAYQPAQTDAMLVD